MHEYIASEIHDQYGTNTKKIIKYSQLIKPEPVNISIGIKNIPVSQNYSSIPS
jgi:hypothetical protein